ncbi:MAG: P1 family peptidase, partial [Thermoanaerobaculia bacterium]|nr:P1 family peptidase [Thermoanaerobaculia bacterium]
GHRNLGRLAERTFYGMARTGAFGSNGSGDYAIAFSTAPAASAPTPEQLANDAMQPLFEAVVEATEEAILDSLFTARTVEGFHGTVPALPVAEVVRLMRRNKVADER